MAATYIPALVIKRNNDVYLTPDLVVGVTMSIPTPGAGGAIDGDYWAVPISDKGVVTGFNFVPTTSDAADADAPTPQSFHVFRLVNQTPLTDQVWYVLGTTSYDDESPANCGYIQAAADAECCAADPCTLPTTRPTLYPCQVACEFDADGSYFFILALPTDAGTYYANGYLNGETLAQASGATAALLRTSLASLWSSQGSPEIVITWTVLNGTSIKGVITSGSGSDVLCAVVTSS